MRIYFLLLVAIICGPAMGQDVDEIKNCKSLSDSLFIAEVEQYSDPEKVLHAEPLYIDLIRDLGARKGEKEWNFGIGLTDQLKFDSYKALVEYEWAPADRIGLEIELPFTIYSNSAAITDTAPAGNKLDGVKTAIQWSFWVSEKTSTSMALGYINELELHPFREYSKSGIISGNSYNPFFVAAKRWGKNFHTLLYTGPVIEHKFGHKSHLSYQINSNFHYMISGTRNFIGAEINKEVKKQDFDMTLRPQMRVSVSDKLLVGIITGIPVKRESQRLSTFIRLIYEPGHKSAHHHPKKT